MTLGLISFLAVGKVVQANVKHARVAALTKRRAKERKGTMAMLTKQQ